MDREDILKRLERIRLELEADKTDLLRRKIMERPLHIHPSDRNPLTRKLIEKMRKRLVLELELILEPLLDNQREIHLRFLEEIERLKKVCPTAQTKSGSHERDAAKPVQESEDGS
jgi:hypothetical protein